jgi:hypothetical protein
MSSLKKIVNRIFGIRKKSRHKKDASIYPMF